MVWTVLKFGAIIFAVFDLDFERDSFLSNAILVNVTLSSSEFRNKRQTYFHHLTRFSSTINHINTGTENAQNNQRRRGRISRRKRRQKNEPSSSHH